MGAEHLLGQHVAHRLGVRVHLCVCVCVCVCVRARARRFACVCVTRSEKRVREGIRGREWHLSIGSARRRGVSAHTREAPPPPTPPPSPTNTTCDSKARMVAGLRRVSHLMPVCEWYTQRPR